MSRVIMKVTETDHHGGVEFEGSGTPLTLLTGLATATEALMDGLTKSHPDVSQKDTAESIIYAAKLGVERWLKKHQNCGGGGKRQWHFVSSVESLFAPAM